MSGDGVFWIVLLSILLILNPTAITLYKNNKLPLWLSGLIILILAPILAFITGYFFVKNDHSTGGDGVGGAIAAVVLGWIIVFNGIIYMIVGIISKIRSLLKQRK